MVPPGNERDQTVDERPPQAPDGQQLHARYANFFQVGHHAFEFVIEFGQLYEDQDGPQRHTRIVTSPAYVHELAAILGEAISAFEAAYGPIGEPRETED